MDQLTDVREVETSEVGRFYDRLAVTYDTMTGFDKRFVHEKPFFSMLLGKNNIRTALDAGAGTGFHSLLLGQLGVAMTAIDISKEMLGRLKEHAKKFNIRIETVETSFQDIPQHVRKKFDAVFCMGNSLPHLPSREDLERSLANFLSVLNPGGILFLQQLNYDRIFAKKERVQSVKEMEGVTFVRFYEFHKEHIVFNILKLKKVNGQLTQDIDSVSLRPALKSELTRVLKEAGFFDVQVYGSIMFDDFHEESSKDLVILARKSAQKN